jgi:putative hydrolase of the HAD superfamily
MTWVVFAYAGVISFPPPEHAGGLLPQTVGAPPERFWPVYWDARRAYDVGVVDATGFWDEVCSRLGRPGDLDLFEVLAELDLRAWSYTNPETLGLLDELDRPLALLSNAPAGVARMIDGQPWAGVFRQRFFSADLGLAKPDPRIFQRVCELLDAKPGDLTFVDDRADNIEAAREFGIDAVLFTGAADLGRELTVGSGR